VEIEWMAREGFQPYFHAIDRAGALQIEWVGGRPDPAGLMTEHTGGQECLTKG